MASTQTRNVKWVEGLRGITSGLVIATHVARAWDFPLFWPVDAVEAAPRLLQLPVLRIPFQGRIGVPIFAFLTGFVCAYKPLRLAYQQGNTAASLHSVARSAFRRPPRLILPAAIATFISFVLSCLGAYRAANNCDGFWVRFDAPDPLPTFSEEVARLFRTTLTTWTTTENLYDRHQWAMRPLLIGAFQVYVVLAATIGMRFRYRVLVHSLLMVYWLMNTAPLTETFGANLALGTLLAELSLHRPTQNFISKHQPFFSFVVTPLLLSVGLFIGSYPGEHDDWAVWSTWLNKVFINPAGDHTWGSIVVPLGSDAGRRMSACMVQMVAVSIFLCPTLRDALSHRWLTWLGHLSFAVYLVHGTILRTVGMWIVYGPSGKQWDVNPENGLPVHPEDPFIHPKSRWHIAAATVVFVALSYVAAWAWMRWVDSACARATQWLESKVFESDEDDHAPGGEGDSAEKGYARAPLLGRAEGSPERSGRGDR